MVYLIERTFDFSKNPLRNFNRGSRPPRPWGSGLVQQWGRRHRHPCCDGWDLRDLGHWTGGGCGRIGVRGGKVDVSYVTSLFNWVNCSNSTLVRSSWYWKCKTFPVQESLSVETWEAEIPRGRERVETNRTINLEDNCNISEDPTHKYRNIENFFPVTRSFPPFYT